MGSSVALPPGFQIESHDELPAGFQIEQPPKLPSVAERAVANLPKSLLKNSPLNVMPGFGDAGLDSEGHMKRPLESLEETGRALLHPIDSFKEMFANDPIGALQIPAMTAEGLTNLTAAGAAKLKAAGMPDVGTPEAIAAGTGHFHAAAMLYARKILKNLMAGAEEAPAAPETPQAGGQFQNRTPIWQGVTSPSEATPVSASPIPGVLPSGRVVGRPAFDAVTGEQLTGAGNGEFSNTVAGVPKVQVLPANPPPVQAAAAVSPTAVEGSIPSQGPAAVTSTAASSKSAPGQPIGVDESQGIHGGVENTPAKSVDEWLADLKKRLEDRGISFDKGNPQARFDEGSGAPIIKSELRKSGATGEPANPGRMKLPKPEIAEDSPLRSNPKALQAAVDMYNAVNKGKKMTISDLIGGSK